MILCSSYLMFFMALELLAKTRTIAGKAVTKLRRAGEIPGVVYGHGFKNILVSVAAPLFNKLYGKAGESSLIDLVVDGKKVPVLVKDVSNDVLSGDVIHVDFYQVRTDEKITAEIPLKFVGESLAVKDLKGVLVRGLPHLKVSCFPQDLVPELTVDLSPLKTFTDRLSVKDVVVPANIQVLDRPETIVANVTEQRAEEVAPTADMAAAEKAAIEGQAKVEKKDKKAGEEEEEAGDKKGEKKADAPKKK